MSGFFVHLAVAVALDMAEAVIIAAVLWHFWPQITAALGG